MRTARRAALVATGAALLAPAAAGAVPPGGPAETPGDPPASVALLATSVAAFGHVAFTGTGFLTSAGEPQRVYVKLDDVGDEGIGPFLADAQGNVRGSVWLGRPGAPGGLDTPGDGHWVRFLAGLSGAFPQNGPPRSLKAPFAVVPAAAELASTNLHGRAGHLRVRLRAPGDAVVEGAVRVRRGSGGTLARGTFVLPAGRSRTVRVPLTRAGRRAVAGHGRVAVRVALAPEGAEGTLRAATLRRAR